MERIVWGVDATRKVRYADNDGGTAGILYQILEKGTGHLLYETDHPHLRKKYAKKHNLIEDEMSETKEELQDETITLLMDIKFYFDKTIPLLKETQFEEETMVIYKRVYNRLFPKIG